MSKKSTSCHSSDHKAGSSASCVGKSCVPPLRRRRKRRMYGSFGDLCEISEGLAVVWRRKGCTEREMWAFANDDPAILCDVVPALHELGFSEKDVLENVPHNSVRAFLLSCLSRFLTARSVAGRGSGALAVPPLIAMSFVRRMLSRCVAALQNKAARPAHYEAEKSRRQALARERRRIHRRTTANPCPTKAELLEAWTHVRDSKESLVRFGSMLQDLECYVDNSLRMDEAGRIIGRNAGIKGWLHENLPELAAHYSSVMRYKSAAKKLRQIVGLTDPTPIAAVLANDAKMLGVEHGSRDCDTADGRRCMENGRCNCGGNDISYNYGAEKFDGEPSVEVVRARAIYLEAMEGVPDVAARVMARIDALCDPEQKDEAAMLRSWREKYEREITVRRKRFWWHRLTA